MSFTTPLFVPLVKGLDRSKEPALAPDELQTALNVEMSVDGQVKGRPSRAAPEQFVVRDPSVSGGTGYLAAQSLAASGFTPRGLLTVMDKAGERAALGCNGRLFVQADDHWADRGHFACMKVDRPFNFDTAIANPVDSRVAMTLDFGRLRNLGSSTPAWGLLTTDGALDREQSGTSSSYGYAGNGARCGTTTAVVTRGGDGHIYFHYRVDGAGTVTTVDLASTSWAPDDDGDAPVICCSHDATVFYVAYIESTGTEVKVLRVTTTGSVTHTGTTGIITAPNGIWLDNTPVAGGKLVLATTDTNGLTLRGLDMADLSVDSTSDTYATTATVDGADVVVGCQDADTVWWCYRSMAGGDGDLVIGVWDPNFTTMTAVKRLRGGAALNSAYVTWAICHQPVKVDGRMYMTLAATTGGQSTATWLSLDLTNLYNSSAGTGPFAQPTLVARGPSQATYPHLQPSAAVTLADGTGWAFPTCDWTEFQLEAVLAGAPTSPDTVGMNATAGLNFVTFSGPRAAQAGGITVFSGSVPRAVASGDCYELGFPFCAGIPGFSAAEDSGGFIPDGDYGVQVCWRWTDAAGNVHRSAPSAIATVTVASPASSILAVVTNPWLSEKASEVYVEVYVTPANPTAAALHYLQASAICDFTAAWTSVTVTGSPALSETSEPIYTDGSVLGNYAVPADGGVVAVGRRLWMADASTVYASKYLTPGQAPGFNDEGTHQVDIPASVGRIVALERLDDKVIVLCERGVFAIQDGGPDRTGAGAEFMPAVQLSRLPIAGPRSSCSTDAGVLFCTPPDATDPHRGGPWLIDRQLTFTERQYLGRAASDFFSTADYVPDVAYSPERQQVYITTDTANGASDGLVVLDLRVGKWSVWDTVSATNGALRSVGTAAGSLWALNTEPATYDGTPGTDSGSGAYAMVIKTSHIPSNGQNGLGWGRVRGVRALEGKDSGAHTLTFTATQDGTRTSSSGGIVLAAASADTTWPTTRQAPEWRLPAQKCATLQLQLSATPATATWSAIQLDVAPLKGSTPAKNRS